MGIPRLQQDNSANQSNPVRVHVLPDPPVRVGAAPGNPRAEEAGAHAHLARRASFEGRLEAVPAGAARVGEPEPIPGHIEAARAALAGCTAAFLAARTSAALFDNFCAAAEHVRTLSQYFEDPQQDAGDAAGIEARLAGLAIAQPRDARPDDLLDGIDMLLDHLDELQHGITELLGTVPRPMLHSLSEAMDVLLPDENEADEHWFNGAIERELTRRDQLHSDITGNPVAFLALEPQVREMAIRRGARAPLEAQLLHRLVDMHGMLSRAQEMRIPPADVQQLQNLFGEVLTLVARLRSNPDQGGRMSEG